MRNNRSKISNSQSATRTMKFHSENHRSRRLIPRKNIENIIIKIIGFGGEVVRPLAFHL